MKGTDYEGMDSISFVEYNSAKSEINPERFGMILKYIGPEICKSLSKRSKKKFALNSDSKYVVNIHLDAITGKAGMTMTVSNYVDSPEKSVSFTVEIEDGRWNSFDRLMEENCEKMSKKILKIREVPYRSVKHGQRSTFASLYF